MDLYVFGRLLLPVVLVGICSGQEDRPTLRPVPGFDGRAQIKAKLEDAKNAAELSKKDELITEVEALNDRLMMTSSFVASLKSTPPSAKPNPAPSKLAFGPTYQEIRTNPEYKTAIIQTVFGAFIVEYPREMGLGEERDISVYLTPAAFSRETFPIDLKVGVGTDTKIPQIIGVEGARVTFGTSTAIYELGNLVPVSPNERVTWTWHCKIPSGFAGADYSVLMVASRRIRKNAVPDVITAATIPIKIELRKEKGFIEDIRTEFAKATLSTAVGMALPALLTMVMGYITGRRSASRSKSGKRARAAAN